MKWDLYAIFFLESLVKNIFFFKKQKTKKTEIKTMCVLYSLLYCLLL